MDNEEIIKEIEDRLMKQVEAAASELEQALAEGEGEMKYGGLT